MQRTRIVLVCLGNIKRSELGAKCVCVCVREREREREGERERGRERERGNEVSREQGATSGKDFEFYFK